MNQIVKAKPAQTAQVAVKSVLVDMASRFGMEPAAFEATVRATCMKPDKNGRVPSREEFAAFLLVSKEYKLNPLTKEIYAFPAKGGGIVPIVSLDGWANLINSHPAMDGMNFEMHHDEETGELIACTCSIYRKDRSHPIVITEYLSECIRNTEPWAMRHRMLRHKSLIQCARYAFGFSGIYDEDEGAKIAEAARDITPARVAPKPPKPPALSKPDKKEPEKEVEQEEQADCEAEITDEETGEILEGEASEEGEADEGDKDAASDDAGEEVEPDFDFDGLEAALAAEKTIEGIEERWNEYDPEATLEGQEQNQAIALSIKKLALKRVAKREAMKEAAKSDGEE